ncbi:MAG: hypothetical protein JWQ20_697 [Conexibacter sp.]|nr:hypothetical protein [Conexibacter sp.]
MTPEVVDPLLEGRKETPLQRCDRNLVELLQEVRVVQTGVQVLFAFMLTAPLSARFPQLSSAQRAEYLVTLVAAGAAALLLMAPTAYHRILFRCGDKEHLVRVANRYTLVGLACVAVAMLGSLAFVASILLPAWVALAMVTAVAAAHAWCWCAAPLLRRRSLTRTERDRDGSVVSLSRGRLPH